MKLFKTDYLYVKVSTNAVEITNLTTDETISRKAVEDFSTTRVVVANFNNITKLVISMLRELGISTSFFSTKKILIQQMEKQDGGLSDIEKRALRDVGEQVGARFVILIDHPNKLSSEEALLELKERQR